MKISLSKSQWLEIGKKAGWKIAGAVTHTFNLFSEISQSNVFEIESVNYTANGVIGIVNYKNQQYQIEIKPIAEKIEVKEQPSPSD